MKQVNNSMVKKVGLFVGPVLFVLLLCFPVSTQLSSEANKVIAVAALMLIWWLTEAIPIAASALIPIIFFPLLRVYPIAEAAVPYSSPIVYLFMGGFVIALAMEKWNLHKRIALSIIKLTGTQANGIILGFMIATALLSMWISNTATAVMMLPIAQSVMHIFLKDQSKTTRGQQNFALAIFMGIAYAANIGGVSTLVGTPPNIVLSGFLETSFQLFIPFAKWLMIGIPFSAIFLLIAYFVLVKLFFPNGLGKLKGSDELIREEYDRLGKLSSQEIKVGIVFLLTALLWVFRKTLQLHISFIELSDPVIALFFALLLFVIPSEFRKGTFLLTWKDTKGLPWGILILFGGGLSLAKGMQNTGIIDYIGTLISSNQSLDSLTIVLVLLFLMIFMTEVMSNVALVTILLPVVGGIAQGLNLDPLLVCIPITIAASCAFMLPMATPPNAIVFASGYIKVSQMAKVGIVLNCIAILLLMIMYKYLIPIIF